MARGPGTRVIEEIDHGTRTVNDVEVRILEEVWNGGAGSSFEVYRVNTAACLTMDEAFDDVPDDDTIADLIEAPRNKDGFIDYTEPSVTFGERDEGQWFAYRGGLMQGPYPSETTARSENTFSDCGNW